jgi:hypothetical protein
LHQEDDMPIRWLAVAVVLASLTTPSLASTRVAVYAIVDEIDFEPSSFEPDRAWISGVFVVPVPISSGMHADPQRGHLYFTVNPTDPNATRRDWELLRAVAGTGTPVGFGQYWTSCSRPGFPAAAPPDANCSFETTLQNDRTRAAPSPYPIPTDEGIVTVFDDDDDVCPRFGEPSGEIIGKLREAHSPGGTHEPPPVCVERIGLIDSSDLDSAFVDQTRDDQWAAATETLILKRVAEVPGLMLSDLRVECRDTICRIHAAFPTRDYQDATGNRLFAGSLQALPGFAPGGKVIPPRNAPTIDYYFQRRSPH